MPIEAVKIPQNVYIEDRIVGPLTLRQVIISAIGCGFSYVLYSMVAKAYGGTTLPLTIIIWIPGALSVLFAFIKFNDLTLFQMVLLTLERMSKAPVRVWTPRRGISITIRTTPKPEDEKKPAVTPAVIVDRKEARLAELSAILDQPVDQPEIPVAAKASDLPQEETLPSEEEVTVSTVPPLPVNRSRITASPLPQASAQDTEGQSRGRVSLFHDIHPA